MRQRPLNVIICAAVALFVACLLSATTYFAYWPSRLRVAPLQMAWFVGTTGGIYYGLVPIAVLSFLARRRLPTPALSASLAVLWLAVLVVLRLRSGWPGGVGLLFVRDFVYPLPVSLSLGLAFGLAARRLLATKVQAHEV